MDGIIEGMTPREFIDVINIRINNLVLLGHGEESSINTETTSNELCELLNEYFGTSVSTIGITGGLMKSNLDGIYVSTRDTLLANYTPSEVSSLTNTEDETGKTVYEVDTYIYERGTGIEEAVYENIIIKGLGAFDPDNYITEPEDSIGISIKAYKKVTIRNCIIKNVNSTGIQVFADEILIENCHVENCNFTAYNVVGKKITMNNCTSKLSPMHTEAVTREYNSWIKMKDCRAENLWIYGIKWYGIGTGYFLGIKLSGDEQFDYHSISTEGYGFYIDTSALFSVSGKILDLVIIDFVFNNGRIGIKLEKNAGVSDKGVDRFYHRNFDFTDILYVDEGIRSNGILIPNDVMVSEEVEL